MVSPPKLINGVGQFNHRSGVTCKIRIYYEISLVEETNGYNRQLVEIICLPQLYNGGIP